MKKLCLLLVFVLMMASFSAFAEIDPSSLDPYEIVWYTVGEVNDKDAEVEAAINAYLTEKFNCTLKIIKGTYSETIEKIQYLTADTKTPWDLITVDTQYANYVAKEAFYPMSDLVNEYGQDILAKWPAALWQAVTINGEYYAIPTHKYSCSHFYFAISIDQANAAGVDVEWVYDEDMEKLEKWDAFKTYLFDMAEAGAGMNGYITHLNTATFQALYPYEALTGNAIDPGVCLIGDDSFAGYERNEVFNQFATPEFAAFVKDAYELAQAGALPKDPDTSATMKKNDPAPSVQDSMAKRLAGYERTYQQDYEAYFPSYGFQTTDKIFGSMNAINAHCADPARVMMFLNACVADPDFANLVAYGLEGINWTRNEDGQIARHTDGTQWYLNTAYFHAFIIAEPDNSLPVNMVEMYEAFDKVLVPSDNVGFAFDESSILTELAAVRQVTEQYLSPLVSGLADPETTLPAFLDALNAAGVDVVIDELQNQLDAWRVSMGF